MNAGSPKNRCDMELANANPLAMIDQILIAIFRFYLAEFPSVTPNFHPAEKNCC